MKFRNYIVLLIFLCLNCALTAQGIWTIKDPNNIDVILEKDSAYFTQKEDYLILYAIDPTTNTRNVLATTGDTSFWLLDSGFDKTLTFTDFVTRKENELVFGIGDTWYTTKGTPESTQIFYEDNHSSNAFDYIKMYELSSSGLHNNLGILSIEKITGDTLMLYHQTANGNTEPLHYNLRIIQPNIISFGGFEGSKFFVGSVYNELNQTWGEVSLYREYLTNLHQLLPLGIKNTYAVDVIIRSNYYVSEHLDDGSKRIYRYSSSKDSLIDVTASDFPDHTVLDVNRLKWILRGIGIEPAYSYQEFTWIGRNQSGTIQHFLRDAFVTDYEIVDLRNDPEAEFMFYQTNDDSIYYYNYSEIAKGLIKANFRNGSTKKEPSSITFDNEFKLQAYKGKMYFGRYDAASNTIVAALKDFNTKQYEIIESTSGIRIQNPLDFTFLDDKIIVHSRSDEGVKLVVFDPDAIVSVFENPLPNNNIRIYPNPSHGIVKVSWENKLSIDQNINYIIRNMEGKILERNTVDNNDFSINLTNYQSGLYYIQILSNDTSIKSNGLVFKK